MAGAHGMFSACVCICFLSVLYQIWFYAKKYIKGGSEENSRCVTCFLPFVRCFGLFGICPISRLSFVLFLFLCTGTGVWYSVQLVGDVDVLFSEL